MWTVKIGSLTIDTRLLGLGAVFIAAGIVGGGLSAMGVQVPAVGSAWLRALLALVGGILVVGSIIVPVLAVRAQAMSASRKLAAMVSTKVEWPTDQVRATEPLSPDERWWVVYAQNDGEEAVYDMKATVTHESGASLDIPWGPLQPAAHEWYVLRPDSGIPPDGDPPEVVLVYTAQGLRWRNTGGRLERIKRGEDDEESEES